VLFGCNFLGFVNHGLGQRFLPLSRTDVEMEGGLCPCSCASLQLGAAKVAGACFMKCPLFCCFLLFSRRADKLRSNFLRSLRPGA